MHEAHMFWNKIAGLYDLFENIYNKKVFTGTGKKVAEYINSEDEVLECACGTGAISICIAEKCKNLIATDFAEGMLKQASKKCHHFKNVTFQKADITNLEFADASFDKVVAGNVIHLLPEPELNSVQASLSDAVFRVMAEIPFLEFTYPTSHSLDSCANSFYLF